MKKEPKLPITGVTTKPMLQIPPQTLIMSIANIDLKKVGLIPLSEAYKMLFRDLYNSYSGFRRSVVLGYTDIQPYDFWGQYYGEWENIKEGFCSLLKRRHVTGAGRHSSQWVTQFAKLVDLHEDNPTEYNRKLDAMFDEYVAQCVPPAFNGDGRRRKPTSETIDDQTCTIESKQNQQ